MSINAYFYSTLSGDATWAALATGGLFAGTLPDNPSFPAASYFSVDVVPVGSNLVGQTRIQVSHYAVSYDTAHAMADACVDVAHDNGWAWEIGPDLWDDVGNHWVVPVDVLITKGV